MMLSQLDSMTDIGLIRPKSVCYLGILILASVKNLHVMYIIYVKVAAIIINIVLCSSQDPYSQSGDSEHPFNTLSTDCL